MTTDSHEFILGVACLAAGLLVRCGCWYLESRHAEAMKHADDEFAEEGWRGVTVLGIFQFGAALLLFIGAALVTVSFIVYGRF